MTLKRYAVLMKRWFALFLLLFFIASVGKGWHLAKDGFHMIRVRQASLPLIQEEVSPEVNSALNQSFSYIGRGHQCYAFESQDGKYVLKLPRLDRYEVPLWLNLCRFSFLESYRKRLWQDVSSRKKFIFNSFQIAFQELKEETGVLYLHLNQTDHWKRSIQIRDQIGRKYRIDLDRRPYLLQEKRELMMPIFKRALKLGDREKAQEILTAFLTIIASRSEKEIFNKDPSFLRNFGYDGKKGYQIDIGSFYHKEGISNPRRTSFLETTTLVIDWLRTVDPEMASWFQEEAEKRL